MVRLRDEVEVFLTGLDAADPVYVEALRLMASSLMYSPENASLWDRFLRLREDMRAGGGDDDALLAWMSADTGDAPPT